MRDNQPVTGREYELQDEHFLISRTDLKGRITYANPAFIEVSGFSHEELVGAPHNIVRHPDMPWEAFASLWDTLASGNGWRGMVKNRRKNGDHYWVDASVTPIVEDGEVMGYASVRVKADRAQIDRAEKAYASIRAGKGRHLYLFRGRLRRRGLVGLLGRLNLATIRARLSLMVIVAALMLLVSGGMGLYGLNASGERLAELNRDGLEDVVRLQQLGQLVNEPPQRLASQERMSLLGQRHELAEQLEATVLRAESIWQAFISREVNQAPETRQFEQRLEAFLHEGLMPMAGELSGEAFDAMMALNNQVTPLQEQAQGLTESVNALIERERRSASAMAEAAAAGQRAMLVAQGGVLAAALLLLIVLGMTTLRAVTRPLDRAISF